MTSAPYIRWRILAPTFSTKRLVGCQSCVRKQLVGEIGGNLLAVWHSVISLAGSLACFVWNASRIPVLKANPGRVEALLADLGLYAEPADLPRIAAALAAAMVAADGVVHQEEVDTALDLGAQLVEGFTPELFIEELENVHLLPSPTVLAGLLADCLDEPTKNSVMNFLLAIAVADSNIHESEVEVLRATATAMRTSLPELPESKIS